MVLITAVALTLAALLVMQYTERGQRPVESTDTEEQSETVQESTLAETEEPRWDPSGYTLVSFSKGDTKRGELVLVNRQNAYDFGYEDAKRVELYPLLTKDSRFNIAYSDITMAEQAYNAFVKMTNDCFAESGFQDLMITAAYRDMAKQSEYYNSYIEAEEDKLYVEEAGYSDHHTGLAFDLKIFTSDGISYRYSEHAAQMAPYIVNNYHKYGFIMRYPADKASFTGIESEGNHMRYVGLPHSVYMTENNLCLEEYLELVSKHPVQEPLEIVLDGITYLVYSAPVGDSGSQVYVPSEREYTVSGSNTGMVIITCKDK